MNSVNCLLTILLHTSLLVTAGAGAWWLLRRSSAARVVAGGRLIMAGAVLLAAAEGVVLICQSTGADRPGPVAGWSGETGAQPAPGEVIVSSGLSGVQDLSGPGVSGSADSGSPEHPQRWILSANAAGWLGMVWLGGAALVLLRWGRALAARWRMARHAAEVRDAAWLRLLSQTPGGRDVRLLQHRGRVAACSWGLWRPVILIPADADAWPADRRAMVLAHECAHLRRRDPLWLAVGQWFLALQWCNPLAWGIVRRCRLAGEQAADDVVLLEGADAPAYAGLLVSCARQQAGLSSLTLCQMASGATVTQRVERILAESADRRAAGFPWWAGRGLLVAGLAAGIVSLTPILTIADEESPAPVPSPPAATEAGTDDSRPQNTPEESLAAALRKLRETAMQYRAAEAKPAREKSPSPRGGGAVFRLKSESMTFTDAQPVAGNEGIAGERIWRAVGHVSGEFQGWKFTADEVEMAVASSEAGGSEVSRMSSTGHVELTCDGMIANAGRVEWDEASGNAVLTDWPEVESGILRVSGNDKTSRIVVNTRTGAFETQNCAFKTVREAKK